MAEILMKYIFFNKENKENKCIKDIILERIDSIAISRNDENIEMKYKEKDYYIEYKIIQKSSKSNCYLILKSTNRVNVSMHLLEQVDDTISKTSERKYYHIINNYDGISDEYCKKLYPKYACFERKLREMVFIILTKAYGGNWYEKTTIADIDKEVVRNARGKENLISDALEHMDYAMLERYLFEKRIPDCVGIIEEDLSKDKLNKMNKNEICNIIDKMRPVSLWECHFLKIGSAEKWETDIKKIHNTRNKVAHNKKITRKEYDETNKNLNRIIKRLREAVGKLQEINFTEKNSVDILEKFALFSATNIKEDNIYEAIAENFGNRIQQIVEQAKSLYQDNMVKLLRENLDIIRQATIPRGMVESLNVTANIIKDITPILPQISEAQQRALSVYLKFGSLHQYNNWKSDKEIENNE